MSQKFLFVAAIVMVTASIAITPLIAHHSIAGSFHTDEVEKLEGKVVEFQYRNPHAFLFIEGRNLSETNSQPARWAVEWSPVSRLEKMGVKATTLQPGDAVVIAANPSRKEGEHTVHLVGIIRPADGWKAGRAVDLPASH